MGLSDGIRNITALFKPIKMADDRSVVKAKARRRPNTSEVTPLTAYINQYWKYLSDPDKIIRYKSGGLGRELYDDMIDKDAQVKNCLRIRKNALLALGYDVEPYIAPGVEDPTPEDVKRANELKEILSRTRDFDRGLREILSAIHHGYSINEIRYRIDSDYVVIDELKSRNPDRFFYNANFDLMYKKPEGGEEKLDPVYFVQYTYDPRHENPYGTSELRTVYWAWWFKSNLLKYLVMFSERFGQPTIIGKYPSGWGENQIDNLLDELETIQEDTVGVVEDGTMFELLEPKSRNEGMFIEGCRFFDEQIAKAILGNVLSTDTGSSGSGSYALGGVHEGVRLDILEADAKDFQSCLNSQIRDRLVYFNWGDISNKPKIIIPYSAPEDTEKLARTLKDLNGIGVKFSKKYIHETFGIPMPDPSEETYGGGQSSSPFGDPFGRQQDDNDPDNMPFKSINTAYYGRLVGKAPLKFGNQYDIASALYYYDDLARIIRRVYIDIQKQLMFEIDVNTPMYGLIDQVVRQIFETPEIEAKMATYVQQTGQRVAQSMAMKFGLGKIELALQEQTFKQIAEDYLQRNFYGKGRLPGIADTMKKILRSKVPAWESVGYDYNKMKTALQATFTDLKDWKIHQIAQTELSEAAHYAAFETIERTGLKFKAYFFVDPQSCEICQEWASKNPYTVEQARSMGLPHIQCNDQWSFELEEGQ